MKQFNLENEIFHFKIAGDVKRVINTTKTTMSYTSAIMTAGRVTKPTPPSPQSAMTIVGAKPRAVIGPTMNPILTNTAPPATAPASPQVSPPQPMPPSPKHHRYELAINVFEWHSMKFDLIV